MVTYRGYKTFIKYDEETAYGSGSAGSVAASVIKGRIQSVNITENNNLIRTAGIGEDRNETFVGWGNYDCTWSMEYDIADFDFLRFAIGAWAGSGTTAAPWYLEEKSFMDYTAGSASGLKSFFMDAAFMDVTGGTNEIHTLSGCIINNVGLSLALGSTLKCSVDGFSKQSYTSGSVPTFTADTTKPWIFAQGAFLWNGSSVARVTSATINFANNFDPETGRELGSRFITAAEPGLRKYDWTATVKMTSAVATTLRDHFYGQANSPNAGLDGSEPTLYSLSLRLREGTASGDRQALLQLANCSINDISRPVNIGDNIVELTFNGAAKSGSVEASNRPIKWYTTT